MLLAVTPNAINATLYYKLNFNFSRDIAPVASIARSPSVMLANPSFPAKTVPEFIAYAKANPGKINMASQGNGTSGHLAGELFKMTAGIDMVHVPSISDDMRRSKWHCYSITSSAMARMVGGTSMPRSLAV